MILHDHGGIPMLSLRRWRASHLLWTWTAYWLVLVTVTLGPLVRAAWRVTRPGHSHGTVLASFGDGVLRTVVTSTGEGAQTVTASTHLGPLAFWVAVPPLLLWVLWLASRPQSAGASTGAVPRLGRSGMSPLSPRDENVSVRDRPDRT
jgi:hypothetical protein